ncbi:uncharacterized protein EV154DRAFT_428012 [Mucor mucedo]|uniref:uncharacterized protein n=1 Tax=Mucor mucedo TaxID=29922 RepID=UPI002220441D|nr:uncharacterized protein EV154DRAFT_428012 [Mucor mucedo]KAI7884155.1 hypothetical protein EV154DRAFT_428012 [Mucor mucedo]
MEFESNGAPTEIGLELNKVAVESDEAALDISLGSDKLPDSTSTLKEISANIPIPGEPVNVDVPPEIKKPLGENDPSTWKKKFKRSNSIITIDENSFEDFQTSGLKNEVKGENTTHQRPDSEKVNSMKYNTFKKVPRIFVGSRTHKQLSQLISELKTKTRYNPRTTILGSRDQLCIHPKVSKASNKTESCIELLDKNACHYKHKIGRIMTHPSINGTNRVWDIEDLVTLGKKVKGCPFYASRKIYEGAEVVFCPYNYIIDPLIRKVLDINLKESIIILDEAHNIEDSSRSAGSFEVDEQKLATVKKELDQIIRNRIEGEAHQTLEVIVNYLYDWITSTDNKYTIQEYEAHHCNWTGVDILQKLAEGNITPFLFHDVLKPAFSTAAAHAEKIRKEKENNSEAPSEEIDNSQSPFFHRKCLTTTSLSTLQGLFMVFGFLFKEETHFEDDYQMVLTKKIERTQKSQTVNGKRRKKGISGYMEPEWSFKLAFKCLNPGIIFKDMTDTTRSVILTSGTLSPLNTFASELETDFEVRLEANHVIDKSHVWVGGIPQGPNRVSLKGIYSNWESFHFQDDLGEAICEIAESVPFGVLCFLPAYNTLDKLMHRWKLTKLYNRLAAKKMIFIEPRGSDKVEFENTIGAFYKQIDAVNLQPDDEGRDGAIFFAVFRGKVSEGIDFSDNYCRAVVTIGIPYPAV